MGHRSVASHRLAAACSAALGVGVPYATAWAQESPPNEGPLEEIIVTASRREASIQDIPFNIAALGPESIDRLRITDLSKFTRAVPGLYVADQGPRNSNLMTVRGL